MGSRVGVVRRSIVGVACTVLFATACSSGSDQGPDPAATDTGDDRPAAATGSVPGLFILEPESDGDPALITNDLTIEPVELTLPTSQLVPIADMRFSRQDRADTQTLPELPVGGNPYAVPVDRTSAFVREAGNLTLVDFDDATTEVVVTPGFEAAASTHPDAPGVIFLSDRSSAVVSGGSDLYPTRCWMVDADGNETELQDGLGCAYHHTGQLIGLEDTELVVTSLDGAEVRFDLPAVAGSFGIDDSGSLAWASGIAGIWIYDIAAGELVHEVVRDADNITSATERSDIIATAGGDGGVLVETMGWNAGQPTTPTSLQFVATDGTTVDLEETEATVGTSDVAFPGVVEAWIAPDASMFLVVTRHHEGDAARYRLDEFAADGSHVALRAESVTSRNTTVNNGPADAWKLDVVEEGNEPWVVWQTVTPNGEEWTLALGPAGDDLDMLVGDAAPDPNDVTGPGKRLDGNPPREIVVDRHTGDFALVVSHDDAEVLHVVDGEVSTTSDVTAEGGMTLVVRAASDGVVLVASPETSMGADTLGFVDDDGFHLTLDLVLGYGFDDDGNVVASMGGDGSGVVRCVGFDCTSTEVVDSQNAASVVFWTRETPDSFILGPRTEWCFTDC